MTAFEKLMDIYKTQDAIAKVFKLERQAIGYWKREGVPSKRAKQVQKVTRGRVTILDVIGN